MLRRSARWLVYEQYEGISGDKGHMTLQQACTIFGFQLNQPWTKKEVKKKFQTLVLKYHPDHGGTSEQFLALKEAQHIMLTHRHDKGVEQTKRKGEVNFKRMNYDDLTGTIHRQTADKEEYRSFGIMDFAVFFCFLFVASAVYLYRAWRTQQNILRSRWSLTDDQVSSAGTAKVSTQASSAWHPWKADVETRDRMDDIGLLQGSIRQELVDEKRAQAPPVYTPWQSGGPFARNSVSQQH